MNQELIKTLEEMRDIAAMLGQVYRENAYSRAIARIKTLNYNIKDNLELVAKLPGIGTGIMEKITEFVNTGKMRELEKLKKSRKVKAAQELSRVLGAGPKTVEKWIEAGITSLAKLRREVGKGKITLNTMQKYGVLYYTDLNTRIPRDEVTIIAGKVKGIMLQIDPGLLFEVAGSYRRGAPNSGDIDIIVSNKAYFDEKLLTNTVELLRQDPNFIDVLSMGEERTTFLYKGNICVRQIDILHIRYGSYYAALNYFTGSALHNQYLRGVAKSKGYRLNQAGLYKMGKKMELIPVHSEEEIYKILGVKYIPPWERN